MPRFYNLGSNCLQGIFHSSSDLPHSKLVYANANLSTILRFSPSLGIFWKVLAFYMVHSKLFRNITVCFLLILTTIFKSSPEQQRSLTFTVCHVYKHKKCIFSVWPKILIMTLSAKIFRFSTYYFASSSRSKIQSRSHSVNIFHIGSYIFTALWPSKRRYYNCFQYVEGLKTWSRPKSPKSNRNRLQ